MYKGNYLIQMKRMCEYMNQKETCENWSILSLLRCKDFFEDNLLAELVIVKRESGQIFQTFEEKLLIVHNRIML